MFHFTSLSSHINHSMVPSLFQANTLFVLELPFYWINVTKNCLDGWFPYSIIWLLYLLSIFHVMERICGSKRVFWSRKFGFLLAFLARVCAAKMSDDIRWIQIPFLLCEYAPRSFASYGLSGAQGLILRAVYSVLCSYFIVSSWCYHMESVVELVCMVLLPYLQFFWLKYIGFILKFIWTNCRLLLTA
eukprot:971688_1